MIKNEKSSQLHVTRFGGLSQQVKVFIKDMIKKKKKNYSKQYKYYQQLVLSDCITTTHTQLFFLQTFLLNPNPFLRYCFVMGASFVAHVLFLLWFFATTFSFFLKAKSNVSCNEKDKQALLNFKKGLSDPFGLLSTQSDQEDCSSWDGVVYDNKTGQVTELDLNVYTYSVGAITIIMEITQRETE